MSAITPDINDPVKITDPYSDLCKSFKLSYNRQKIFLKTMTYTQKNKITLMTEGNIFKILLFFSIPLILGNFLQQMYSTVDSIIVGNYVGSQALAAVSSTSMIVTVIISGCQGIAVGAGVVIAQCLGAKNRRNVFRSVHTSLAF